MSRALLAAARAIVAEFDDAEAGRGGAFPAHYEDRNGKVLENRAMVRIRLLNRLRAAVKAEGPKAPKAVKEPKTVVRAKFTVGVMRSYKAEQEAPSSGPSGHLTGENRESIIARVFPRVDDELMARAALSIAAIRAKS